MSLLLQNQALFVQQEANFLATFAAFMASADERFARIEADLEQIKSILLRHEHAITDVTETIRQRIGFKSQ